MYPFVLTDNNNKQYAMSQLVFTEELLLKADKMAKELPIYERSHRGLQANQVGVLGELVAEEWFRMNNIKFIETKNTQHDYQFMSGKTIDIKTKDRTVIPRLNFDCSIPLYNHEHQQPDYYLFISLKRDKNDNSENISRYKKAFILGAMNQDLLHERGRIWQAGEVDPDNGTKFWTSCINVNLTQLVSLQKAAKSWHEQSFQTVA